MNKFEYGFLTRSKSNTGFRYNWSFTCPSTEESYFDETDLYSVLQELGNIGFELVVMTHESEYILKRKIKGV